MALSHTQSAAGYREFRPHPALDRHVSCRWTSSVEPDPGRAGRRIVPDGCIDVVWRDDLGLVVEGPATEPVVVDLPPGTWVAGIRFRPGMAPSLLRVDADELRDCSVPLADVWGQLGRSLAGEVEELPVTQKVEALERVLLRRLADAVEPDDVVVAAVARLVRDPAARVVDLSADLGLGPRHLLRRFSARVGYGPRTFGRIARFQHFLALAERSQVAGWSRAALAAEAGYADQAHLARECRALGGLPPGGLLRARRGPSGEVRFVQDGS